MIIDHLGRVFMLYSNVYEAKSIHNMKELLEPPKWPQSILFILPYKLDYHFSSEILVLKRHNQPWVFFFFG